MPKYIISVTAADRVGIVGSVTGSLLDLGGNILDLSQTVMRGYSTILKTTAVRVIPVPGKGPGDRAVFGGLFGETAILPATRRGARRPSSATAAAFPPRSRGCEIENFF